MLPAPYLSGLPLLSTRRSFSTPHLQPPGTFEKSLISPTAAIPSTKHPWGPGRRGKAGNCKAGAGPTTPDPTQSRPAVRGRGGVTSPVLPCAPWRDLGPNPRGPHLTSSPGKPGWLSSGRLHCPLNPRDLEPGTFHLRATHL